MTKSNNWESDSKMSTGIRYCDLIVPQLSIDDDQSTNTDCTKVLNLLKDNIIPNLDIFSLHVSCPPKMILSPKKVKTDKENHVDQHTSAASSSSDPVRDSCSNTNPKSDVKPSGIFKMNLSILNEFIERLNLHPVVYGDVNIKRASENVALDNIFALLDNGNPFFNSLIYLKVPKKGLLPTVIEEIDADAISSYQETINSLLVIYALLLTKGITNISEENVPECIKLSLMGSTTLKEHKARVSTFPVDKLGFDWLKGFPINKVDKTLAEKLGSQNIAGYHYFNALSRTHLDHPEVTDENLKIRDVLIKFYDRGPVWEVHPLTRADELQCLDQNMLNLMCKLYTDKTIKMMKKNN